ncbi:MAG: hypothetical protein HGA86_08575, partial [Anaerolineaceae bacterium]|nr:hypothetical protein [Anaerolineaceae bacterium]
MKNRWQLILGVLVSLFFVWLAVQGLHLQEVWFYLRTANYIWLLPGIAVYFLAVVARTWRWHYLLRPVKSIDVFLRAAQVVGQSVPQARFAIVGEGPQAENLEIHHLVPLHQRVVPREPEERRGERNDQDVDHAADERYVYALPAGWPHPRTAPGAEILGD